jgi:hypothetical protein
MRVYTDFVLLIGKDRDIFTRFQALPPRGYPRREELKPDDALAAALFTVEGVTGLLINEGWITVNKDAASSWPAVKKGVQKALATVEE